MSMTRQPTLRMPTDGRTITAVGDVYRFLALAKIRMARTPCRKPSCLRAVVHPRMSIVERKKASISLMVRSRSKSVGNESPHSFKNESGKSAKMLISVAPAGLEQMFCEEDALIKRTGD